MLNKSSIQRLQLSNFKLNSLLEITQSINENLTTVSLLEKYENILRKELNIGRLMIFSYNQKEWECILKSGTGAEKYNADDLVKNTLCKFSDINYVTSSTAFQFKGFDIVIPVFQNDIAIAYVLIGDIDEEREGVSPTIKHLKFIQTITNVIVVAIENKHGAFFSMSWFKYHLSDKKKLTKTQKEIESVLREANERFHSIKRSASIGLTYDEADHIKTEVRGFVREKMAQVTGHLADLKDPRITIPEEHEAPKPSAPRL